MAQKKITVVLSQAQGKDPRKRQFEEEIVAACLLDPAIDISVVPHLYDLPHDHTAMLLLRSLPGDFVILGWLYPRALRWTLDRAGIKGKPGRTLLNAEEEQEEETPAEPKGIGSLDVPNRKIYCLDLRDHAEAETYLQEIRRIAQEAAVQTVDLMQWVQGNPSSQQLQRYLQPANSNGHSNGNGETTVKRRWYPVIDYDRCTNCMECIDFCLFGVYGLDEHDRILVEQQDNCKKGCPACSRVCPENAIIFPEYKAPAIAGANTGEAGNVKIDLSKLFGAPSAIEIAAMERDSELIKDGRQAVGFSVGIPKRQAQRQQEPKDDLDNLMDDLDNLDL